MNNRNSKADIELWDCSGNTKFQNTWPALVWELHGIIFVFDPDNDTHGRELDFYYEHFVKKAGIQDGNCLALALNRSDVGGSFGKSSAKLCKNFKTRLFFYFYKMTILHFSQEFQSDFSTGR